MPKITAIFWDVGGVLLTNAWDHVERNRALIQFELDEVDFNDRHQMLVSSFERGKITLDEYLRAHHLLPDANVFQRCLQGLHVLVVAPEDRCP